MDKRVIRARKILLIGVFPPVDALTLLLPYPPNAGRAINRPPTTLAVPKATSSRFALRCIFCIARPFFPSSPKLLAATEDSKKPSNAMRKLVLKVSDVYLRCIPPKGQCIGKRLPLVSMSPKISTPFSSQRSCQHRMADRRTTMNRSGIYAIPGCLC
jgi:hypothetical protein